MAQVVVHLHARAAELAGVRACAVELPEAACAGDVKDEVARRHPALSALLPSCAIATDAEYLGDAARVGDARSLHVIPPVSGG